MNAQVFRPSGEPIGKFEVQSVEELPQELEKFLASGVRVPLRSYVEAFCKTWTIAGLNPLNLREPQAAPTVAPIQRQGPPLPFVHGRRSGRGRGRRSSARHQMMVGLAWLVGGIAFTAVSYMMAASSPAGGGFFVAFGAIIWGSIRFFTGLAGVIRDRGTEETEPRMAVPPTTAEPAFVRPRRSGRRTEY